MVKVSRQREFNIEGEEQKDDAQKSPSFLMGL
jgi:hypothetical protein